VSFPSYSLESVSQALLGEGKAIGDEYDKMAEIKRRYQDDKPALASYNIRDCEFVLRIFDKGATAAVRAGASTDDRLADRPLRWLHRRIQPPLPAAHAPPGLRGTQRGRHRSARLSQAAM
jgi:hypothetical protein